MPGEQASVSEKTKYQFSQAITRHQVKNNLSETEIANKLDLDRQTTTRLLRGYVENFSLDSLTGYVEKLHLPLQIKFLQKWNNFHQEEKYYNMLIKRQHLTYFYPSYDLK
ncbi:3490_t:CDS:2 [Entrophospora sp. SA101]|nr:3490_t:CDS:2 [Entrophospora sp. SA101]